MVDDNCTAVDARRRLVVELTFSVFGRINLGGKSFFQITGRCGFGQMMGAFRQTMFS
jgi:hypothetical protein